VIKKASGTHVWSPRRSDYGPTTSHIGI